jgi:uridine kinase
VLHLNLKNMAALEEPVHSFLTYERTAATRRIEPSEFVIVEGLFVLYWPRLRSLLDTKVYVETDPAV